MYTVCVRARAYVRACACVIIIKRDRSQKEYKICRILSEQWNNTIEQYYTAKKGWAGSEGERRNDMPFFFFFESSGWRNIDRSLGSALDCRVQNCSYNSLVPLVALAGHQKFEGCWDVTRWTSQVLKSVKWCAIGDPPTNNSILCVYMCYWELWFKL